MNARPSPLDALLRLNRGCCPVHGLLMSQAGDWRRCRSGRLKGQQVAVVECPRGACAIQAYAADVDGPWESCGQGFDGW